MFIVTWWIMTGYKCHTFDYITIMRRSQSTLVVCDKLEAGSGSAIITDIVSIVSFHYYYRGHQIFQQVFLFVFLLSFCRWCVQPLNHLLTLSLPWILHFWRNFLPRPWNLKKRRSWPKVLLLKSLFQSLRRIGKKSDFKQESIRHAVSRRKALCQWRHMTPSGQRRG